MERIDIRVSGGTPDFVALNPGYGLSFRCEARALDGLGVVDRIGVEQLAKRVARQIARPSTLSRAAMVWYSARALASAHAFSSLASTAAGVPAGAIKPPMSARGQCPPPLSE
jgi:hypothetical protein